MSLKVAYPSVSCILLMFSATEQQSSGDLKMKSFVFIRT